MTAAPHRRRVVIVTFEGVQSLDLTGPLEVFSGSRPLRAARRQRSRRPSSRVGYAIETAAPTRADPDVERAGGRRRHHAGRGRRADRHPRGGRRRRRPRPARRVADGRPASLGSPAPSPGGSRRCAPARSCSPRPACSTAAGPPPTGPRCRPARRRATRRSTVDPDPIFVRDGDVWTSAGVTAGMDLALALVEDDLGREVALTSRPPAGAVPPAAGRPGPVQRPARRAQSPTATSLARPAGLDRRPPRPTTCSVDAPGRAGRA